MPETFELAGAESRTRTISSLKHERGQIKARITKLTNYLEKAGIHASDDYIDKHIAKIEKALLDLPRIQEELQELEPETDHESAEELIMDDHENVLVLIRKFRDQNRGGVVDRNSSNSDRSPSVVTATPPVDFLATLPRVDAKKFDGRLEDWRTYRDWFIQTIHNRHGLSNAQRLDYLKRTLAGEASNTISAFQATDDNYAVAWDLLQSTYDIEYILILRHYDLLTETPAMKNNSAEEIRKLLNTIQMHTLAMKALGERIENWNTPIVHTILKRLDKDTAREWNRKMQGNKMPRYEDILSFLREEATRLTSMAPSGMSQSAPSTSKSQGRTNRPQERHNGQRVRSLLTTTDGKLCPVCKEEHAIEKCSKFLSLTTPERIQEARKAALCLNCLRGNHKTRQCKSSTCSTCQGRHNAALHLTKEELTTIRATSA